MSLPPRTTPAWLRPREGESGRDLVRRIRLTLTVSLVGANLIGAAVVVVLGFLVLPLPEVEDDAGARTVNAIAAGAVLLVFTPLGSYWGLKRLRMARRWLEEDRPPTPAERQAVLRGPRRIISVHVVIWSFSAILFGLLNGTYAAEAGGRIATLIAFSGISTCAFVYLISERQLRPAAARALAGGIGERRLGPGIKTRTLGAWAMGSAVPVLGLMLIGASTLIEQDFTRRELAVVILALGATALIVGAYALFLAARAIADPVVSLRQAVHRVEEGELEVGLPVYDASEIGRLQAGFNAMVTGLRERERIRDLFGRHVGEEVAQAAIEAEVELGGEVRDVSVLFTDIVGSTTLAAERPAEEVVGLLNRFFAVVVEVVGRHGGWVNKFEGDAALVVFGAPVPLDDAPSAALAAGRELARRLPAEVPELEAAIGVSAGAAVAGNIGERSRFEYTVIGDPVNEAARLTELAKERPGRLLASGAILERAAEEEAGHWRLDGAVTLRGRSAETRLAVPVA